MNRTGREQGKRVGKRVFRTEKEENKSKKGEKAKKPGRDSWRI